MKQKKIEFAIKEQMVKLAGTCFWFWGEFHSFLGSCGVQRNLMLRYPKGQNTKYDAMRNILNDLENKNEYEIINNIVSGFYRLTTPIDKENLDVSKAKKLLREFKESIGNDPIERAVKEQERLKRQNKARKQTEKSKVQIEKLEKIRNDFLVLFTNSDKTPQKRGFDLEKIFFEILELEEFEYVKPYRHPGEQIDGQFNYAKFDYLVEIKWIKDEVKQKELSIFDGKIRGKAQSTRGLFLAVNYFDKNAVIKYTGDSPRIILMDGQEFMNILEGRITLFDCLKFKIDALVRLGDIYRRKID